MKKIDIGCGNSKKNDFIGIDILKLEGVDIVHDLNVFPYPFRDNEIDEVWMDQCLEHLDNPIRVVEEINRICKNGAKVTIGVPFFRSFYAYIDPTHKNFFTPYWFDYFDPNKDFHKKYQYSNYKYKVENIIFDREWIESNNKLSLKQQILIKYANNNIEKYTQRWSHLFPLNSLTFYLTVIK